MPALPPKYAQIADVSVIANQIHAASSRRDRPLLCLNCAAFTETLLESELFGYERGAFTGALHSKPGLLETADGGSVFLDEVGEMPPSIQSKLLRVLEQKQVSRIGGLTPRAIDVRFIAATNRDLEGEVDRGTFRRDMYFRLNGVTIVIPPLRDRVGDRRPGVRPAPRHRKRAGSLGGSRSHVTGSSSPGGEARVLDFLARRNHARIRRAGPG